MIKIYAKMRLGANAPSYVCQCSSCNGTGKYDHTVCPKCRGWGLVNLDHKPTNLHIFYLELKFRNGKINSPKVWATTRARAVMMVEHMCLLRGWSATVS